MKLKFGKYCGLELSQVPRSYLQWLVSNFQDCTIKDEALKILNNKIEPDNDEDAKSLEEQANEILGEKPIDLLRRGRGKYRK